VNVFTLEFRKYHFLQNIISEFEKINGTCQLMNRHNPIPFWVTSRRLGLPMGNLTHFGFQNPWLGSYLHWNHPHFSWKSVICMIIISYYPHLTEISCQCDSNMNCVQRTRPEAPTCQFREFLNKNKGHIHGSEKALFL
jgi:hypothetical protein